MSRQAIYKIVIGQRCKLRAIYFEIEAVGGVVLCCFWLRTCLLFGDLVSIFAERGGRHNNMEPEIEDKTLELMVSSTRSL